MQTQEAETYVTPREMIKRLRRVWFESQKNDVTFTHFSAHRSTNVSVGRRVTAWTTDLSKQKSRTYKVPLRDVVKLIHEEDPDEFAVYCNGHLLKDCSPLDVIFYVAVVERNMSKARKQPWSMALTPQQLRESTERVSQIIAESDAVDAAEQQDDVEGIASADRAQVRRDFLGDVSDDEKERRRRQRDENNKVQQEKETKPEKPGAEDATKAGDALQAGEKPEGTTEAETAEEGIPGEAPRGEALKRLDFDEVLRTLGH